MANRKPIVQVAGEFQQLQAADILFVDQSIAVRENEYEVGTDTALYVENQGSATSEVIRGIHARTIHDDNSGSAGAASTAIWGEATTGSGSDNLDHIVGVQSYATHTGSGTVARLYGSITKPNRTAGSVTDLYGHYVYAPTAPTNITNAYGLYIEDYGAAATGLTYTIFAGTGTARFGGHVNVLGNLGIGIADAVPAFVLDTAESGAINQWVAATYFTDTNGSIIRFRKANGTIGSPTVIADGDTLGVFSFEGYRNGAFPSSVTQGSVLFEARVTGTVSGDSVPGAFLFQVTNVGDTTNTLAFYIAPNSSVGMVNNTNLMPTGGGAPVFVLRTAGSAPTGVQANTAVFYCDAFGTNTGEMYAINSNGDSTLLTDVHYPTAGYGDGTNYTLTDVMSEVDRGTTDSAITVAHPGEFMIRAGVVLFYNAATFAAGDTITLKVRNTTDGADIANTTVSLEAFALTTFTGSIQVQLPEVTWQNVNVNRRLAIFAQVDAEPSAGSLEISADSIVAYKRQ